MVLPGNGECIHYPFINIQNKMAVLSLIGEAKYLKVFSLSDLQSQIMFYIDNY